MRETGIPWNDASGDLRPRPECRATWHGRRLGHLPNVELGIASGLYAQAYHLGDRCRATLTETVKAWREFKLRVIPLPHPSWDNNHWLKQNPWFGAETLPYLR